MRTLPPTQGDNFRGIVRCDDVFGADDLRSDDRWGYDGSEEIGDDGGCRGNWGSIWGEFKETEKL